MSDRINEHAGGPVKRRLVVIGGGIIGLATAHQFLRANPGANVVVLEKEAEVGRHQSGHNSGVLHAGLYYRPGSNKALLARSGLREMTEFCKKHGIAHEICGKLVVAADESEVPRLEQLMERGIANGLNGLRRLGMAEAREIEPHVGGVAALAVPEEGVVDYPAVCRTLVSLIGESGGTVVTRARVVGIRRDGSGWLVETDRGDENTELLVNCAGLYADRVARLAGEEPDVRIVPFRGEYFLLRPGREHLVRNLIYPVPDPAFPFLGVHLTRRVGGGVEAGPNAVLAFAREGYVGSRFDARDVMEMILFPGLRRFVGKHLRTSVAELRRSFSRSLFCASLRRLVPELDPDDLVRPLEPLAGVRAQAMYATGELVEDFHLLGGSGAVHVLNAPSPGATASLAIGRVLVGKLER